ncbi:MAG TPA: flavoprotein, partial [Nitrososphaerales archaeon]|nr:flavoprotein [Nitrososphaerales archaeon]
SPFTAIHLENMLRVAAAGGIIVPAAPAFYTRPKTLDDVIDHTVGKVLDMFRVDHGLYPSWKGPRPSGRR